MISGMSVQPPGNVPGRTNQRDQTKPYPDFGPAWVADCYGIIPDTMRGDLSITNQRIDGYAETLADRSDDEVAREWASTLAPGGVTVERLLDEGHI